MVILIFIICLTHTNVWESMGKPCSCTQFIKSRILYSKSLENPYQVLQVTCDTCFWTEEKSVRDCLTDYSRLKIADNYAGKDEIAMDEGLVSITVIQILKYADT